MKQVRARGHGMHRRVLDAGIRKCMLASLLVLALHPAGYPGDFQDDLRARRVRAMERLGAETMLILFSAPQRTYSRDIEYEYHQDSDLYYLSGIEQADTVLVLAPGIPAGRELLFISPRDPLREHWQGALLSTEEAAASSGVDTVCLVSQFDAFVEKVLSGRPLEAGRPGRDAFLEAVRAGSARIALVMDPKGWYRDVSSPVRAFETRLRERFPSFKIEDATVVLRELRQTKTEYEQSLLRKALEISCEGQLAGMRITGPGRLEYEVEAAIEGMFKSFGAAGPAYPSIVASGPNASILHYSRSNRRMEAGELLLVDAAAHYRYMAGDVTRTYPVNGKFTSVQKDIYRIVLAALEAGRKAAGKGITPGEIHERVTGVLAEGLHRLGLVTDRSGTQYKIWATHGTCHHIGLDVHDTGDGQKPLAPGMAFTIEPGVYVRPEAIANLPKNAENDKFLSAIKPAFERYQGIAVRIEDSFLLTETGLRCLSDNLPRTADEIEAVMK